MAQDKLSKNWRENQTTHETYSAFDDLTDDKLLTTAQDQWDKKVKEAFDYKDYWFVPSIFQASDPKTKEKLKNDDGSPKLVKLLYRYMEQDDENLKKRVERIGDTSAGGRTYAAKKDIDTYVLAVEWIENGDAVAENSALAEGKIPLKPGDIPDEFVMFRQIENKDDTTPKYIRAWGNKYKLELVERT